VPRRIPPTPSIGRRDRTGYSVYDGPILRIKSARRYLLYSRGQVGYNLGDIGIFGGFGELAILARAALNSAARMSHGKRLAFRTPATIPQRPCV
jgi:hypothetical protein